MLITSLIKNNKAGKKAVTALTKYYLGICLDRLNHSKTLVSQKEAHQAPSEYKLQALLLYQPAWWVRVMVKVKYRLKNYI
jgi:hypothetical protein